MRILICSDGTDPADKPARIGGIVAGACQAEVKLLGIAEQKTDEAPLREALESEAKLLGRFKVKPEILLREGEPVEEILKETSTNTYDLVTIGTRIKRSSGPYLRSKRTYEVIKAIPAPVLVAAGQCEQLASFLVCTGGKRYIEAAVQLTGEIAARVGASVTLLHVMAEPPAMYANLMELEQDVDTLLSSGTELGENLRAQKAQLEKLGVTTEVHIRHGIVIDQVFAELYENDHDLIVTGSSHARGPLQHYIMGDLTRSIVNRARCPVLVARPSKGVGGTGVWDALKRAFGSTSSATAR